MRALWMTTVSVAVAVVFGLGVLGCNDSDRDPAPPPAAPATLAFTTGATLPGGQVGQSYSQQLRVTGGASPYSFGLGGGVVPPSLIVSGSGLVQGTPTLEGAYTFSVTVTDTGSRTATRQFSLTISAP